MQMMQDGEFEFEGESEGQYEGEYEFEGESEGEFEGNYEFEGESDGEFEGEFESEQFFGSIKKFLRRAAPILRNVANIAAPVVGTAVGGPLGAVLGQAAGSLLGEGEFEYEFEGESEGEYEGEFEGAYEGEFEDEYEMGGPLTQQQALGEMMAAVAAQAQTEAEAEAMAGAAAIATLSAADRAALHRILPSLVRGIAMLASILRRRRVTRPAVRLLPTILRRTTQTLQRRAAAGRPISKRIAARVMAAQIRKVLSNPRVSATALQRNVRAARYVTRPRQQAYRPRQYQRPRSRSRSPLIG